MAQLWFESLVNLEGCKTVVAYSGFANVFESLVNLEGCKTTHSPHYKRRKFESLVNLEGCKTFQQRKTIEVRLRVLLI